VYAVKKSKVGLTPVADYLKEGLLALVPYYKSGYKSVVITMNGKYPDKRAVSWLLETIAVHYQKNLSLMRKRSCEILNLRNYISLVFTQNLVLMPVKLRKAVQSGEKTIGYVLYNEIETITNPSEMTKEASLWRSVINFKNGHQLFTLNSASKLGEKMDQSKKVLVDYQQLYGIMSEKCPFSREALREQLLNSNCVVVETLIKELGLETTADSFSAEVNLPAPSSRFAPELLRIEPGNNDQIRKE
jgi:hypothetical protein